MDAGSVWLMLSSLGVLLLALDLLGYPLILGPTSMALFVLVVSLAQKDRGDPAGSERQVLGAVNGSFVRRAPNEGDVGFWDVIKRVSIVALFPSMAEQLVLVAAGSEFLTVMGGMFLFTVLFLLLVVVPLTYLALQGLFGGPGITEVLSRWFRRS